MRRLDAPLGVALLFSLLIPLIQISLHLWARTALFSGPATTSQTGIGVLYNLPDTLSYASWAAQAKLGHITFVDLFTTEPHARTLFNLYFLIVGSVSRISGIDPLALMELSALVLGPLSVFATLMIVRELKLEASAQALSIVLVFLGSGVSGLFIVLDTLGVAHLRPGVDGYYLDMFPLMNLVFYPYHAATFVLLALIVLWSIKVFAPQEGPSRMLRAALLGVLFLVTGLVRPYEVVTLALVFNLTALFGLITSRRVHLGKTVAVCCIVDLLASLPVAYAAFMATQPVWGSFAERSMALVDLGGVGAFLKGFAMLWLLASLGLIFAVADRRRDLCFVACWAIVVAVLLLVSPSYGTKFAGGSVLPTGILAAYGIQRLFQSAHPEWRPVIRPVVLGIVGVMTLTPIVAFADMLQVGAPRVDTELLAAGKRIRELEGARIPVVLTTSDAGALLPGLFGERVYAGHWSLTPGYLRKSDQLRRAGLETPGPGESGYDRALLTQLIRESKANYILLKRDAPAAPTLTACSPEKPVYEGERWIAVGLAGWSCL